MVHFLKIALQYMKINTIFISFINVNFFISQILSFSIFFIPIIYLHVNYGNSIKYKLN